jgi:hypothetical protein
MRLSHRTLLAATLLLVPGPFLRAQAPPDLSGHWAGSLQAPQTELAFELDLTKSAKGDFGGTVSMPTQDLNGLPLRPVTIKGRSVTFRTRTDQAFVGNVAADGKSIVGAFTGIGPLGNEFSFPFTVTRTGAAKVEPPLTSAAVTKELVGTWNGTLESDSISPGKAFRFVLTLANHANGTATGHLQMVDEGELEIPLSVTQKASKVTLELKSTRASFSGALNAAGTELAGTYSQGSISAPLTFHRAPAPPTANKK